MAKLNSHYSVSRRLDSFNENDIVEWLARKSLEDTNQSYEIELNIDYDMDKILKRVQQKAKELKKEYDFNGDAKPLSAGAVKLIVQPKALDYLERLKGCLKSLGYKVEGPDDTTDTEFSWSLFCGHQNWKEGEPTDLNFTIELRISEEAEAEGEGGGFAFGLHITRFGGLVVGTYTPNNYSIDVWKGLTSQEEVEEAWNEFEAVTTPVIDVANVVKEHYNRVPTDG
jgi:hypothetical protein